MPRTNLSLGNLHRAVSGSVRTTQQVSIGQLGGAASNSSFTSFAIDSVTFNVPTFTYIVESTTENASFSFGTSGSLFSTKVSTQANNYTCSFNNSNFTVGTPVYANTTFPINAASVAASQYSEASSSLTLGYADGYNINATNHGGKTSKTLYAVDVYNTINQPDFCLLFGTQITLANGSSINVEDLVVGDIIKSWVPAGLPDESQDPDSDQLDWRFYMLEEQSGSAQDVVVNDITFNFAAGYYDLNNGLIKATGTHPLWVNDVEINKYHFKAIQDVVIGDKVVTYDETNGLTEIEVTDIGVITEDIEIVTLNVENADVYLANGTISHNKGTSTQPYIPSAGLRMYLDPSKAASTNGTATTDWLDLSGYNTGVRPAGVANAAGVSGKLNPAYNNGASRKEKYWQGASNAFWYKDGTTNINGGYTQFNTSAYSVVSWVRFASHPANGYYQIFGKQNVGGTREMAVYLNSNGSGTYFIHDGTTVQFNSNTFTLSTNVWYMISYTAALNGTNVAYTDTTSRGTISNGAKDYTTSALIQIGGGYGDNNYYFTGQIGPTLFYNRQLNSTEITQVYDYFSPSYK
jgi:hypothetical protein